MPGLRAARHPNVIVLVIDSLRADRVSCSGYARETSPTLDALARGGAWFEQFFTVITPTLPACTSLLSGQYPWTHGVLHRIGGRDLAPSAPWLPEVLRAAGYRTAAVDNLTDRKRWFARGFDAYFNLRRHRDEYHTSFELNRAALRWVAERPAQPFFLFVRYGDPHTPYLPPGRFDGLFGVRPRTRPPLAELWESDWRAYLMTQGVPGRYPSPTSDGIAELDWCRDQYDAEVRTADAGVAELLDGLDRLGERDRTLIVVLGDHGESLGEHGIRCDHYGLYDCVLRPPLILHGPPLVPAGRRIRTTAQVPDLCPTVLDLVGVPAPAGIEGRSLVPALHDEAGDGVPDRVIACEASWGFKWAIRQGGWKLIVPRAPDLLHRRPGLELYDLVADPAETTNLVERERCRAAEWLRCLETWLATLGPGRRPADPIRAVARVGHRRLQWRFLKVRLRWELAIRASPA